MCAFQGNAVEKRLIDRAWDAFAVNCKVFLEVFAKYNGITQLFFVHGVWSFASYMILSRYMRPGHPIKARYLDLAAQADRLAESAAGDRAVLAKARGMKRAASAHFFRHLRYLTEWYSRAMSSQSIVVKVMHTLQGMAGPAKRLTGMFDKMAFLAAHAAEKDDAAFVDDASQIAFEHVGEFFLMYRFPRESCAQFDSLPLTSLTISEVAEAGSAGRTDGAAGERHHARLLSAQGLCEGVEEGAREFGLGRGSRDGQRRAQWSGGVDGAVQRRSTSAHA